MNQVDSQIITLAAFVANLIVWFGRGYLPTDKRINALVLIASTLIFYAVAMLVTGQTWSEIVRVGNILIAILTAPGINLGADVLIAPHDEVSLMATSDHSLRRYFRSINR